MSEQDLRDKLDAAEAEAEAKSAGEEKERPEGEAAETQAGESAGADEEEQNAEAREDEKAKENADAAKLAELQAQFVRLQADFANFRRRTQSEKEELSGFVTVNLLKRLLPILDNFERAEAVAEKTTDVKAVLAGMAGIQKQFVKTLQDVGVEEIPAQGQKFDPNVHEAVMRGQNPELEDETIDLVLEKGYKLGERVIRASKVRVVNND